MQNSTFFSTFVSKNETAEYKQLNDKSNISNLTNDKLLEKFIEPNDSTFFGELYRRHIPLVYGLCLKYLENEAAAHDAVMDIFESLFQKIAQYEIQNFNSWLYSVSKNHCLQVIRQEKRINFVNIEEVRVENDPFFTLIDRQEVVEEESTALNYCMTTLSDEQQTSIRYFYMEEKSYADIVVLTGFSLNSVKSYIQNGKRNLKNCITKVLAKN